MRDKATAIIVAAGKGVRMNLSLRKQYLTLSHVPIIVRTVQLFTACPSIDAIFLVVPPTDTDYCKELLSRSQDIEKECHVVSGGDSRQASVYQGLLAVEKTSGTSGIVAIHDGVRPLVKPHRIESCIAIAATNGACILAIPAQDTLKQIKLGTTIIADTLPRQEVWFAQTPQVFQYDIIRNAHELALKNHVSGTDDAMLVERMGIPVSVVPGSRHNIKITTREDLSLAEALLNSDLLPSVSYPQDISNRDE